MSSSAVDTPADSGVEIGVDEVERACENCATPDDELVLVRRVYVTPESWDTPASELVVETPELWCISCLSQYPHDVVDPDEDVATA